MPGPPAPECARSLQQNVAWALVGNLGYSACQWGVLACIAKLGTAADVGLFALGLALTAPVVTLTNLNLRLLQATDAREDYPFTAYLSVKLLGTSLALATLAMAVCWGCVLATYDLPAAARLTSIRPSLTLRSLGGLTWVALPLGCVAGLGSLTFNVPRYAIEANIDPPALGHFTALAYLFVAGNQPLLALGMAVSPRLARHFVTDPRAFRRLTLHTTLIAGGLGLVAVAISALCGRALLTVAYAPEYAEYAPVLVWLAVATGIAFLATALSYAVTAARRLPEQLPIALLSL